MDPLIAVMVLVSAALHPIRDTILRSDPHPADAYLGIIVAVTVFSGTHVLLSGADLASITEVWHLLLISVSGMLIYTFFLVMTFSRGDLSIYYPITRSSPLYIVLIGVLFLGESYTLGMLAGIALVLIGGLLLQYRPGAGLFQDPRTFGFAMLTMVGHGTGAIADARAVRIIDPAVMFFCSWVLMSPIIALIFRHVAGVKGEWLPISHWCRAPLRYVGAGAVLYGSYYLILLAYSLGGNVAAVTAVRQVSIPFAVLIGGVFLAEESLFRRLSMSLLIAAGVIVIVLSG
jgi:drug/metabolite transporter (DMT)-like permease